MPPSRQSVIPRFKAQLALLALPWVLALPGCQGSKPLRPIPDHPPVVPIALDDPDPPDRVIRDLLSRHNAIRSERDLPPLSFSPTLSQAARDQVAGMIELGKVRHRGVDGSTPADRVKQVGYPYQSVGENVAAGQETAEEVMTGWMDSSGHRRNILGEFEELGAAREEDPNGRPYWCVVFATPIPQRNPDEAADALLKQINTLRLNEQLPPLAPNPKLQRIARAYSQAMAKAGSLKPPGPSIADRVREAGVSYRRLAQSVASGNPGPKEVLDAMTESAQQRRNLLGPFDRVGIGYANAEDGRPFWTILLVEGNGGSL
ncbi:CAP domain-containing protein [Tautonia marina]|uniref:CAP domain-containing protein n=1 Tax=Tautonia marina TaxID=2653855 RepID=UPI001260F5FD|nr:CAP domain-containing protein [Tautonia marina]